jgi:hypothetical protein
VNLWFCLLTKFYIDLTVKAGPMAERQLAQWPSEAVCGLLLVRILLRRSAEPPKNHTRTERMSGEIRVRGARGGCDPSVVAGCGGAADRDRDRREPRIWGKSDGLRIPLGSGASRGRNTYESYELDAIP